MTSAMQRYLKSKGLKLLIVAFSAVAANLLVGGLKAYSALLIPIFGPPSEHVLCWCYFCGRWLPIWDDVIFMAQEYSDT